MIFNLFRRRMVNTNQLFNGQYIDAKGLFLYYFDRAPNVSYITQLDVNEAYPFLRNRLKSITRDVFQHAQYNYDSGKTEFNVTFLVLDYAGVVEIGADYVSLYHTFEQADFVAKLLKDLSRFRMVETTNSRIGFTTQSAN